MNYNIKRFIMTLIGVFLFQTMLFSVDIFVEENGSIQDAINEASDGDTVILEGGTYHENIIIEKDITLKSQDQNNKAVIDGSDPQGYNQSCIIVQTPRSNDQNISVSIEDIEMTGGKGTEIFGDTNEDGIFNSDEVSKNMGGGLLIINANVNY